MSSTLGNINAVQFLPDKFKTFFYVNQDVIYLIECQEFISHDSITEHNKNVLVFLHQHPENGIMYQLTCRKLSSIFISQLLNKMLLNIEFDKYPQLEFSDKDKEILKLNLSKELANYLKLDCKQAFSYSSFIEYYNIYDNLSSLESADEHNDDNLLNQGLILNPEISNEIEENSTEQPLCIYPSEENESLVTPLQSSPRIEPFSENESSIGKKPPCKPPCNWIFEAEKELISYLKENGVDQRNGKKFWIDASAFLKKKGFEYSADQCKIKWKNIKQNRKNNKKNNSYLEVDEILGESNGKRKIDPGLIVDECRRKKITIFASNDIDEVTCSKLEDAKVYTLNPANPKM